ncbi:MAG: hypothetical protein ABIG95_04275 [Candidatus Woesearchaeota archaeon]
MKMKSWITILICIVLLGCSGGSQSTVEVYDPYHGSMGAYAIFLQDSPPSVLRTGLSFRVGAFVKNMGAYNILDGFVVLSFAPSDVEINEPKRAFKLDGKSTYRAEGEQEVFWWDGRTKDVKAKLTSMRLITTYRYQTNAKLDVCIDPDKYGEYIGRKECTTRSTIRMQDQGAPIAVVEIVPEIVAKTRTSGEVEYKIYIQNVGGGEVYSNLDTTYLNGLNQLSLSAFLSTQQITCEHPIIALVDGYGETKCTASYSSNNAYTTTLHIVMDYVYKQTLDSGEIEIKKV